MSSSLTFKTRAFPSRIADLGFSANLPSDWISHELPDENPDFSNPTYLVPLAVVTAPHAAIVYAFAARPAYDDGTLHDWAWYLLNNNNLKPQTVGAHVVGNIPAVVGEGSQDSEVGLMRIRFAFLEDGQRLINLTLTAPEMLADAVQEAWFELLRSFTLETPRGPSLATAPEAPAVNSTASVNESALVPEPDESSEPSAADSAPSANTFARHALSQDASSLDPEMPINANLRNRGVGLVPRVVTTNDVLKQASLAAGSIICQFDVPYGWHVIDDGKRVLVFEPSGKVQIHMNLLPREDRSSDALLDAIEAQMRTDYPHPEFMRLKDGRIHALGARNIHDGDQSLEQYHMLFPGRDQQTLLRARVTSTPDRSADACNLAQLILESVAFDGEMVSKNGSASAEGNS